MFDAVERNGKFGCIQCQRSEESCSRGKRGVFLCRRLVRAEVIGKVIPTSFLKVVERGRFLEVEEWRKRDSE